MLNAGSYSTETILTHEYDFENLMKLAWRRNLLFLDNASFRIA